MKAVRFELPDNNGNIRVFEWAKERGTVDVLKYGTDINETINYQSFSYDHDPVSTLEEAKLVARELLSSAISKICP